MDSTKEQEDKFETSLFELIKNAGNMLDVQVGNNCNRERRDCKSDAVLHYDRVILVLQDNDTFESWVDALLKAEGLCQKLEDKRGWERQNPIFFERVAAKLRHIQKGL